MTRSDLNPGKETVDLCGESTGKGTGVEAAAVSQVGTRGAGW